MATVTKDFRVKNGLVVEGANGTIDGSDIITSDLITGGTQTNIVVTYDAVNKQVNFVAENGVEDSTTDDLVEGLTNLYFTDERAQDAINDALTGSYGHITVSYDDNSNSFTITNDATSANTANTLVERDASGNFAAGNITADLTGNADTATTLETSRTISVSGDVDGSVSFDGSADVDINVTLDTVNSNVGTFGSTTEIPSVTVNDKGLVTGVTTNSVATNLSIAGDSGTDSVSLLNDTLTFTGSDGVTIDVADNNITATVDTGNGIQIDGTGNVEIDTGVTVDVDSVQSITNKTLGTTTLSTDVDANSQSVINLKEPTNNSDAATKNYVDQAESDANTYTDNLIGDETVDGTAGNTVKSRIETAIASLIDSAPETLDTLNELAEALKDNPDVIDDLTTEIGKKVTKAGDIMTGELVLYNNPNLALGAAPKQYVDQAESDANDYTDGEIDTVNERITDLTTDEIAEGTNLYYTDERAQDAIANAIASGTQENITVSYDDANNSFSFIAENGVADSDTDDLVEGSSNLYFTDSRAVSALQGTDSSFSTVDIDSVAKQVAATSSVTGTGSPEVVYSFDTTTYRSAKFLVKLAAGTHTEVSEILVTLDTADNVAITEYAIVGTNGNIGNVSASYNEGDLEINITASAAADATVMGTLLA